MKTIKLLFFLLCSFPSIAHAQKADVIKFDEFQKLLDQQSEKIQVINFWATWCAPCVKELPYFENLNASPDNEVNIILVSLDFADKVDKVNNFLTRKQMKAKVLLLDEIDYNKWIDKVDKQWSGAIPATLVINHTTGKRKFVERELHEGDLEQLINDVK